MRLSELSADRDQLHIQGLQILSYPGELSRQVHQPELTSELLGPQSRGIELFAENVQEPM